MTQRRVMSQPSGRDEYIGQLRFDSLLTEAIIIPDSQLFDGAFFVQMRPDDLRNLIGRGAHDREFPIIVKARHHSLRESLARLLERSDLDALNPFPFHFIASEHLRSELALSLESTPVQRLREHLRGAPDPPAAIAGLLRDALRRRDLQADEDLHTLETGWRRWIEAEEHGIVRVEPWNGPFLLKAAMAVDPIDADTELGSALGRQLYERLHSKTHRSNATTLLADASRAAQTGAEALDIETLSHWYTVARHRAFAKQHGCAFARSEEPQSVPVGPVRRALDRVAAGEWGSDAGQTLTLPSSFADWLTALSGEEFGALTRGLCTDLSDWWRSGQPRALEKIIKQVEAFCTPRPDGASDRPALAQLLAKLGGQTAVYAMQGWKWGLFATLVSEALLAMREQKRQAPARHVRRRVVEYGLERISETTV
jgi:hypothetical protein